MPQSSSSSLVELEFKIVGMSCVNCSNAVESIVRKAFPEIADVQITLLTCKMRVKFDSKLFFTKEITPATICSEVKEKKKGYECDFIGMAEVSPSECCESVMVDRSSSAMMGVIGDGDEISFDLEDGSAIAGE